MARKRSGLVGAALCTGVLGLLAGCGGASKIRGAVVAGPIGRAMVVDARDERLSTTGVGGVTVKAVRPGAESSGDVAPLAQATTDGAGRFELKIPGSDGVKGSIVIVAEGAGVFRTATPVYPPREGQEVLVQVRERASASAGADGP